jgi:hypothetical protein
MANQIITATELLGDNWERIDPNTPRDQLKTFVLHKYQYNKTMFGQSKPTSLEHTLVHNGRELKLPARYFSEFKQQYPEMSVTKAFELIARDFPAGEAKMQVKLPRARVIREILILLSVLAIIAVPLLYVFLTSEKDFSGEIFTYTAEKPIDEGKYVETDLVLIDAFSIEITTTSTKYGVETGKSKKAGNTYILAVANKDSRDTYVYRYDPESEIGKRLEDFLDNSEAIEFGKVAGKLMPLSEIEKLDQSEQVLDYFADTIADYKAQQDLDFKAPKFMIDGRVTPGNPLLVAALVGGLTLLTLGLIVGSFVAHRMFRTQLSRMVNSLTGTTPI